jgi:hypothetical protein
MPKNAVYMAPSPNCMGVLLQQSKKKKVTPNPVFESLNVVYTPSDGIDGDDSSVADLSGVPIRFQSAGKFAAEEKLTR